MDPEVSLLLHCADWKGLRKSQVQVELSERFNRQTDPALENHIEMIWKERLSKEPWIFNGAKFRLHSFISLKANTPKTNCNTDQRHEISQDCDGTDLTSKTAKNDACVLTLRLGLTFYKDYLGSNWSKQVEQLRKRGEMEFGDPFSFLAQPLGVGAVMCTEDEQVVFIRRSLRVAEAGGLLDIPGGHPEPKVVCEHLGVTICEDKICMALLQQSPESVVSELFSSVCAEIRDEINVPLTFLGEPVLLGIALNHTSAGRPSAEFYISCSLTSDQVKTLYLKGGAEANESTDIIFLDKKKVLQLNQKSPVWSELCPSAKGAILLYQTVMPDREEQSIKQPNNP